MRSALAENGNDIVVGKSESVSKISSSINKRPVSKMRLEDQMGVPDEEK